MSETLILALPSKGRLKEQTEAWLADCGLPVRATGGERGYSARLEGLDGVEVRLLSAAHRHRNLPVTGSACDFRH